MGKICRPWWAWQLIACTVAIIRYGLLCEIGKWLHCYGLQVPGNNSSRGEGQSGSSEDLGERD